MLIECPRCAARYDVAEGLIGPAGKSVRCARCAMVWLAGRSPVAEAEPPLQWPEPPQRPATTSPPPPQPELAPREAPAAADRRVEQVAAETPPAPAAAATPEPRSLVPAATLGWVATLALLAAACWGAYAHREAVIEAWPPSERVYLALGLRS